MPCSLKNYQFFVRRQLVDIFGGGEGSTIINRDIDYRNSGKHKHTHTQAHTHTISIGYKYKLGRQIYKEIKQRELKEAKGYNQSCSF